MAIDLKTGKEEILVTGHDFYSNPRISNDGQYLTFIAWDHPNMPWDHTILFFCELSKEGAIAKRIVCTTGKPLCSKRFKGRVFYKE